MNTRCFPTPVTIGDPITARTARRAAAHPRSASSDVSVAFAAAPEATRAGGSAATAGAQILRRWSVAELIASANWTQELT